MHHIETQQDVSATVSVSYVRLKNLSLKALVRYQDLSQSLDNKG